MAMTIDPIKLPYLKTLVRQGSTEYRTAAPELYQMAASGFGYGNLDRPIEQIIRMPLIEATLPHVPNKGDVSPAVTPPEPKGLTIEGMVFRGRLEYYWEDLKDDGWDYWKAQARAFGQSIERTVELLAHRIFNNALNTSVKSGWDDEPLASTNHKLEAGGTYDNTLPAQPPSEALLEQILDYFSRVPTAYGYPQMVRRIYIVTGDNYARRWAQILGSPTAIAHPFSPSDTANQNPAIKPLITSADGRITVVSAPYLVNPDWQFAIGEGHELFFKRGWTFDEMYEKKNPKAYVHHIGIKLFTGWGDARRVLVVAS